MDPSATGTTTRVVLYHHTHWDREWWAPHEEMRLRLLATVDQLLDVLDADPGFGTFVLDGQMSAVQDYLELRPEEHDRLVAAVRAGRVHVGPWFVLADEGLVSGESVVRNLWLGERVARRLGVPTTPVGYLPDQFGHCGQMPQLLAGFGLDCAVVWRGFGAPPPRVDPHRPGPYRAPRDLRRFPAEMTSEFTWEAPDGTRVLGVYLPTEYYQGHVHVDEDDVEGSLDRAAERVHGLLAHLRPYATTDVLLLPYGGDHLPVDPRLPEILDGLRKRLEPDGVQLEHGSLADHVRALREHGVGEPEVVWRGEARAFGRGAHVLPGVLSSRLPLKRANAEAEVALSRVAEPLQALGWALGGRYEREPLWHAWELLVANHAHDSICGCSVDEVHREMATRTARARQVADALARQALDRAAARMGATRRRGDNDVGVAVWNPSAWSRTDVAHVDLPAALAVDSRTWQLMDPDGRDVAFQVRTRRGRRPGTDQGRWTELAFLAGQLPGLGFRRYRLHRRPEPARGPDALDHTVAGPVARTKGAEDTGGLVIAPWELDNGRLRVEVDERDGSLTVTDHSRGTRLAGQHVLTDGGDAGDTYGYAWPVGDREVSTRGLRPALAWVERGPVRATVRVTWTLDLPVGLDEQRVNRSAATTPVTVTSEVSLAVGAERVEIRTRVANTARDHRLRALFRLGSPVAESHADGPFDVVTRPTGLSPAERGSAEPAVHEHPMESFVSVSAGGHGLAVLGRGLPEFAAFDDADGTVALTLLRAVGWLSREDMLTRVGGAGPTVPVPDAQLLGPVEADYALVPHAGAWHEAGVARQAQEHTTPLVAAAYPPEEAPVPTRPTPVPRPPADMPAETQPLQVDGDVLVTAVKRAEDDGHLVVRMVRLAPTPTTVTVRTALPAAAAWPVDLREQRIGPDLDDVAEGRHAWRVEVAPWQVRTLAVRLAG